MSHIIQCTMQSTPESLERVLQVVRVRGFAVQGMQVEREAAVLQINLRLSGCRSFDNLVRQLEKIIGMEMVQGLSSVASQREAVAVGA